MVIIILGGIFSLNLDVIYLVFKQSGGLINAKYLRESTSQHFYHSERQNIM